LLSNGILPSPPDLPVFSAAFGMPPRLAQGGLAAVPKPKGGKLELRHLP